MPRTQLPITGGFYVSRSLPISSQMCKNAYVHINQGGGLANESLFGTPGAHQLATSGIQQQANRGAHVMNGIPYFVNGTNLYRLNQIISAQGVESFTVSDLGTIEGEGRVSMANNNTQLCILSPGGKGYIFLEPGTLTEIVDASFTANGNPQHVVYIDGYFLFTTDTKKFIISALNNGLAYNALDFGTAEADPDTIEAPIVQDNIVYIGGADTFEPFRNAGATVGAGFPFIRIQGGVLNIGVKSPFSLINAQETFFFVGGGKNDEPSIYGFTGSRFAPISTDAIDDLLGKLTETQLRNVFGWAYSQGGDRFVGFTLPTTTLVYELNSKKWHERKSFDIVEDVATEFRYRVNSVVKAYGRILVGDSIDGRVGELDLDFYDEYGQNIITEFSTLPFSNIGDPIFVPSIELTLESGVGNAEVPDPKITMLRSKDGKTWSDGITRSVGKIGEFGRRAIWRRQGRVPRMESFRWVMSDKVRKVFIKLEANIK